MRKVVLNSTPIIILRNIGRMDLLKQLYENVYIPYGVYEEVNIVENCQIEDFIKIVKIKNEEAKQFFPTSLHKGEVEVMILAKEINADLCIIDDYLARQHSKSLGLVVSGTLGILVKAKEKGIIKRVKPVVDDMIRKGFYIDKKLYNEILNICGEK
ncbi:nucleotide-binding protein [Thermoanaerobacterium sp. PSU-2]|uniref:DUF3368 domain-containing protein n=1 Tax=Thermoanaerobacterium sp. PSU-2 TaxID=1930849 RepID=UPI0005F09A85|nr:DUF3368 domain-containing protein [Thermoanaerobacterium sp. PSU-2]ORX22952.1 nucleotide-binding protein [Thermoanaerobacterium sp. PSU-2]